MSLFVINRYLSDEVESSEDRSKALLEKLHEQAKNRQQQRQQQGRDTPKSKQIRAEKNVSTASHREEEPKQQKTAKKRKRKTVSEEADEHEIQSAASEGEDSAIKKKKKKTHKKKVKADEQEENDEKDPADGEHSTEDKMSGVEESPPDHNSLILGGFETKSPQKLLPVLPQWLAKPNLVQTDIKPNLVPIENVPGLHPKLLKKLEANKVKSFFPVQAEVIPAILESTCHGFLLGRGGSRPSDICVSAPTGSGKTLAFVVPIVQALLQRVICEVRTLVVLPTKELAQQVCKVFNTYVDGTGLKVVALTGQKSFLKEQESLVQKEIFGYRCLADILVCTPGRLVDHIQRTEGFNLRHLRFLVIDEADRMIDSMNQDWLNHVTKAVYQVEDGVPNMLFSRKEPGTLTVASCCNLQIPLQKLLFSATLTQNPEKLKLLGLYQPRLFTSMNRKANTDPTKENEETSTLGNYSLPEGLTHYYVPCTLSSKPLILLYFLLTLRFSRVLCFTNSRESSHRLFLLVRSFGGINVAEFSSRLSPGERKRTLKEFEQGKLQILISTDATARGIDIKGVKYVINYDAPQFIRTYIHRVGRTARAGTAGLAFTMLLQVQEQRYFSMIRDAGAPELQRQIVKSENLKQFVQRYEAALTQLQRYVKDERAQKRS